MRSLRLKRILITGAAQGMGRAMAERFAAAGAEVVLTDIDEAGLSTARESIEAAGGRCRTYLLDVTDDASISQTRQQLHDQAGRIDMLVNNAGVVFGGPFLAVPMAKHRTTFRVNVEGMIAMTHAFLPDLIAAPWGQLVFMASASGFVGLPNGATYAASKWATIGLAESIRLELKKSGHKNVGVTTVCPTFIATGMFAGAKPPKTAAMLDPQNLAAKIVEAVRQRKVWLLEPWIVKITPLLRNGLPTGIADFLSDAFGASTSMDDWQGHRSNPDDNP